MSLPKVTPSNLIELLPRIGAWSTYCLAEEALLHYFPSLYMKNLLGQAVMPDECVSALIDMGLDSWQELIVKFHKEVGYTREGGEFDPVWINEH